MQMQHPNSADRHPAVAALHERTRPLLRERMDLMFKGAPDLLLELADHASTNHEHRLYLDTIRTLKSVREQVILLFMSEYAGLFRRDGAAAEPSPRPSAPEPDLDALSLKSDTVLEEMIAVSNMAAKVEGRCPTLIWEVERRIATARDRGVPLATSAIMPLGICQAFMRACEVVDVPTEIKLVIYKVFEHFVAGDLPNFYKKVSEALDQGGFAVKQAGAKPVPHRPAATPADRNLEGALTQLQYIQQALGGLKSATSHAAPFDPTSTIGRATAAHLLAGGNMSLAAPAASDAALGAQLLQTMQRATGNSSGAEPWVKSVAQRMSLAGGLIDGMVSDTRLPGDVRQAIEQLRFPAMKVALSDDRFFSAPDHPLRVLLNELHTMSIAAPIFGGDAVQQVGQLVREVRQQLDLPPDAVSAALPTTRPVHDGDIAGFLKSQDQAAEKRRQAVVTRVKSIVNQEISQRLAETDVPDASAPIFMNGFGPLMCVLLARHGRESAEWNASINRLDTVIDSLRINPRHPEQQPPRDKLLKSIELDLRQAGMTSARINDLMTALRDAYSTLDRRREESETEGARAAAQVRSDAEPPPLSEAAVSELREEVRQLIGGSEAGAPAKTNIDRALETVYRQPEAARAVEGDYTEALISLLAPGAWFRVYSPDDGAAHWLRVAAYYPRHDMAAFCTFDGKVTLSLPGARLVEDLAAGRTEPVNVEPSAKTAMNELVLRHQRANVTVAPGPATKQ